MVILSTTVIPHWFFTGYGFVPFLCKLRNSVFVLYNALYEHNLYRSVHTLDG